MIFGYARVSKIEQNIDRQVDILKENNCDKIFIDKMSGTVKERPELEKMFEYLRVGDSVMVVELTRFGRSVKDLITLTERLNSLGANLKSINEPYIDTTTPQGKMIFTIFASISEFERSLISQRTKEGLASARKRGRIGGRPKTDKKKLDLALRMYESKDYSISEIVKATGISKSTLYKYRN